MNTLEILEQIKKCKTDEEIKSLAQERIKECTLTAREENNDLDYIGEDLSYNPTIKNIDPNYRAANNLWVGYIPKGMKIVYGRFRESINNPFTNRGRYYYLDDESYIYEFYKFFKEDNYKFDDEFDMIVYVHEFLNNKLERCFEGRKREDINKMIYKDNYIMYDRIKEHSIKDLYDNGSAMCTEYAIMGQNILSTLGYEMIYVNDLDHAYNIYVPYEENNENVKDEEAYIVDFSNWVMCVDYNFDFLTKAPFFGKIECKSENLDEFFNGNKKFVFNDYFLYSINDSIIEMEFNNRKRKYGVDYDFKKEEPLLIKTKHRNRLY